MMEIISPKMDVINVDINARYYARSVISKNA